MVKKRFPKLPSLYELAQQAHEADVVEQVQSAQSINIEISGEYVIFNGSKSGGIERLPKKMRDKIRNIGKQLPKYRIVMALKDIEEVMLTQLVRSYSRIKPERSLQYVQCL